jgi:GH15 family glucan-1,4-alpha-glucosidase
MRLVFHNRELERLHAPDGYTAAQVQAVESALLAHGTIAWTPLATGLYPASSAADGAGYRHVWVRDNVYVALALWRSGQPEPAAAVARGLLAFYGRYRHRFEEAADLDGRDVMTRPHVRFDGGSLTEIAAERWPHAQNDALGYCLWLAASLARANVFAPTADEVETLQALVRYLEAIRFWNDQDSGHWEETRKIGASSIGAVAAGLRAWRDWLRAASTRAPIAGVTPTAARALEDAAGSLIEAAERALQAILPGECAQLSPHQNRRYDAALLLLVYPLAVVDGPIADLVVHDVRRYLQGQVGIRRYLRDSYWAPDYDRRVAAGDRTRDYSADIETRDVLIEDIGREAQWCLFDPLLSAWFGERFKAGGSIDDRARQVLHFNRALAHVTDAWACPELYYERDGRLIPNPHTPLLWTQANLKLALAVLRETTPGMDARN